MGVTNALRVAAGLAGSNFSSFMLTRGIQQSGGWLTCVQGREHILYATQVLRTKVDDGKKQKAFQLLIALIWNKVNLNLLQFNFDHFYENLSMN